MNMRDGYHRFAGMMAILCVTALWTCGPETSPKNGGQGPLPGVEAVQARAGKLPLTQRFSGVVRAANQVGIYPEISAVVTEVLVDDGDAVVLGQPLVRLRDKEYRDRLNQAEAGVNVALAQVKQAQARAAEAESELKRIQALADREMVSRSELEAAQTRAAAARADVDVAQARVAQAQATSGEQEENLAQTVLRAPIAGYVGNRNAEVGMLVNTGTRLFTLGALDRLKVEIMLPDIMLDSIEEGQTAEVWLPEPSTKPIKARLARISPFLHPVTHVTDAEIDVTNPERALKPGMFVTVDVFYGESQEATLVPLSALYEHPATGATGVYITHAAMDREPAAHLDGNDAIAFTDPVTFSFVPVEVLARGRMEAGISGVEPDTWVITLGQHLLGGETRDARVRPVTWAWVERLQKLQTEDLMQQVIERKSTP